MPDTFPALQEDALALVRQANSLILAARRLRAHAMQGDADAVRDACREIGEAGPKLAELAGDFALTARHFVAYAEEA